MKSLLKIIFSIVIGTSMYGQNRPGLKDRLFMTKSNTIYHYIQGNISFSSSNLLYGIQYKKVRAENEGGVMTFHSGYTAALNYTNLNDQDFLNSSLDVHFRSYPFTALIRLGAGVDFSTNFNNIHYVSVYPAIGFDIGLVEISYSYLINSGEHPEFSDHRLKIALGPWIKSKYENR